MIHADFARSLSLLRQEKGISQRQAAGALGISQALLSHYENGVREPGLAFVVRACDFYNVSADFLLGRTLSRDGTTILDVDTLFDASAQPDNLLKGSVMATLSKKLVVNSVGVRASWTTRRPFGRPPTFCPPRCISSSATCAAPAQTAETACSRCPRSSSWPVCPGWT